MIRKCGTASTTIVQEQETRNQPENTNQTGGATSIGRRFLNRPPGGLTNEEICDLFVDHLDKNVTEDDRLECIEKIKKERINGKYLVSILDDAQKLDKLYKKLDFPTLYEECFNQTMEFIRSRQAHFDEFRTQKNLETPVQNKKANPTSCEPKVNTQASTSAGNVTGVRIKANNRLKATFGKVNVPESSKHIVGADIAINDCGEVNTEEINAVTTNDKRE